MEYLEKLYANDYGMVKVIAPDDYIPRTKDYTKSIENCMIPSPIE